MPSTDTNAQEPKSSKKSKKSKWEYSDARKLLKDALVKGHDANGNEVSLVSGPGQYPRHIFELFKDLPEFQESDFGSKKHFGSRLLSLRNIVKEKKYWVARDAIALENSLSKHAIPTHDHRGNPPFVDIALPLLQDDMDKAKHKQLLPRKLHKTKPEYKQHPVDVFRKHIHQEVYTRKTACQYKKKKKYGEDEDKDDIDDEERKNLISSDDESSDSDDDDE